MFSDDLDPGRWGLHGADGLEVDMPRRLGRLGQRTIDGLRLEHREGLGPGGRLVDNGLEPFGVVGHFGYAGIEEGHVVNLHESVDALNIDVLGLPLAFLLSSSGEVPYEPQSPLVFAQPLPQQDQLLLRISVGIQRMVVSHFVGLESIDPPRFGHSDGGLVFLFGSVAILLRPSE
jgi:hypothetical protein